MMTSWKWRPRNSAGRFWLTDLRYQIRPSRLQQSQIQCALHRRSTAATCREGSEDYASELRDDIAELAEEQRQIDEAPCLGVVPKAAQPKHPGQPPKVPSAAVNPSSNGEGKATKYNCLRPTVGFSVVLPPCLGRAVNERRSATPSTQWLTPGCVPLLAASR